VRGLKEADDHSCELAAQLVHERAYSEEHATELQELEDQLTEYTGVSPSRRCFPTVLSSCSRTVLSLCSCTVLSSCFCTAELQWDQ
jgi:hypothetical protein